MEITLQRRYNGDFSGLGLDFTVHTSLLYSFFFLVHLYLDLTLLIQGLNQVCILLGTVIKDGIPCG